MSAVPAGVAAPAWSTAWADALAELEMSVAEAESLLLAARRPEGPDASALAIRTWTPPTHLGQLPAPLADRARALVDRQLRVARQLAEAAALGRRQLRALEGMRGTAEATPVYLDTAG
jgi:hypothetical protein